MVRRRARRSRLPGWSAPLLAATLALAAGLAWWSFRNAPTAEPGERATRRPPPRAAAPAPRASAPAPPVRSPAAPPPAAVRAARVAVVIDDLGRSLAELDRLRALGVPITYAVLPFESRTAQVVARLRAEGAEILCHLPLEGRGRANPGPGAIREEFSRRRMARLARRAIDAVAGAAGVNNHMGSVVTSDPQAMRAILDVVGERGLFFLDSRTTADSVAYELAREAGIPTARREVFLDVEREPAAVRRQFAALLEAAAARGAAIGIGHPHRVTLDALAEEVPRALAAGYEFVPVSFLLEREERLPE